MSKKNTEKIIQPISSDTVYSNNYYGFVFSDNIEHWQSSRQLKQQRKNYERVKTKRQQKNEANKLPRA